ncbi:MAG: ASPIC/UnbV domain-containing protein [Planctomycetota bacterium]
MPFRAESTSARLGLPAGAAVATVRIIWPHGREQRLSRVSVSQRLVVQRD